MRWLRREVVVRLRSVYPREFLGCLFGVRFIACIMHTYMRHDIFGFKPGQGLGPVVGWTIFCTACASQHRTASLHMHILGGQFIWYSGFGTFATLRNTPSSALWALA